MRTKTTRNFGRFAMGVCATTAAGVAACALYAPASALAQAPPPARGKDVSLRRHRQKEAAALLNTIAGALAKKGYTITESRQDTAADGDVRGVVLTILAPAKKASDRARITAAFAFDEQRPGAAAVAGDRDDGVRAVKAWMKTIANAAQAYRVRHGAYPADFRPRGGKGTDADPPAGFIGPGTDLIRLPAGPAGVTYGWETVGGRFVIIARENGRDVFGTSGRRDDTATLHLDTVEFRGL